jgi:hypothetical protein
VSTLFAPFYNIKKAAIGHISRRVFAICLRSEDDSLTIVPPYIIALFSNEQHIVLNLLSHQAVHVFVEWSDIL